MDIRPFISYAREDREVAQRLYRDLRAAGAQPWLDTEDLLGGQDWEVSITRAIRESSQFLALISAHSVNKKGFVQKELRHALELLETFPPDEVFVIPVRLDSSRPRHDRLSALHWIDLFPSYEMGFGRLVRSLRLDKPESVAGVEIGDMQNVKLSHPDPLRRDDEGFLTLESVITMVLSRVQGRQDLRSDPLLLFENSYQRTWLVVTERVIACVLDDRTKNELYDPLRWQCRHRFALPVEVKPYQKSVGLIHLGAEHQDWLYSIRLHPDPVRLKAEVEFLLLEPPPTQPMKPWP
ncbi:MAG TPA: toll/interleukin-1 receptor domain-containing protein [Thermoanaerobaculia bacterium]